MGENLKEKIIDMEPIDDEKIADASGGKIKTEDVIVKEQNAGGGIRDSIQGTGNPLFDGADLNIIK